MSERIRDAVLQGIEFIEANLRGEIGVGDVASCVSYSQFYFSREFARHTHCTVYDYILRRKLTEACKELFGEKIKIVDLAFRYGFQSHEVFTRAYKKMFGETPSESKALKPLALFEAIDAEYLAFLSDLRIDPSQHDCPERFFEITGTSAIPAPNNQQSSIVLLSPENPYRIQCELYGNIWCEKSDTLQFVLSDLRRIVRFHSTDRSHALRYYFDQFYEVGGGPKYILIQSEAAYTDIALPRTRT